MTAEVPDSFKIALAFQNSFKNHSRTIDELPEEVTGEVLTAANLLRLVESMAAIAVSADLRINELEQRIEELEGRPHATSIEDQTKKAAERLKANMQADLLDRMFPTRHT